MKLLNTVMPLLFAGILMTGCTKDFEEANTSGNVPIDVTPDLLLGGVIRNTMNQQVNEAWGIGNIVVQYHAKIQFVNEDRYLWNEQNGIWNMTYGNYRNLQAIFAKVGSDNTNAYNAVALILKSWIFAQATEAYGDIPYSEAGKAKTDAIYTPKYDTQESIYNGILADLKTANEILAVSTTSIAGDIMYGGGPSSLAKWRKLANSLRLRYLLRISAKKDVKAEMQSIIGDPANNPIFTGNADNAVLKYEAQAPNQWPLYGARVGSFDEFRVSKTLDDRLTALADPRLNIFGRPSQASVGAGTPRIEGIPNGLGDVDALNYNGGPQGVSRVGYTFACLVCNDNGQAVPVPNAPQALLMTYAELQFLLAEAREKDLISTGTAETYYLNGINANFDYWRSVVPSQYGIDLTMPANYLTQTGVAYTGTSSEKLGKIALQKWVSLYFNGLEGWFEWRRTRMPEVIPGPANLNDNKVPIRYIYPQSEQSLNATNRNEAVARQGEDTQNTATWINK
ncbi:SusD/RagB family nutrient-binding outer membrane lipoprotein [Flavihumibacter sp. UBA7668]|uniref:SusD/RagB family nutrient-binding outer membrane lipoprotein n=1 Tax=Flavihumibacter sp. UBA7668 TaxID=1946542 RepID=UPI0025BB5C1F|nr:SusD/RagB family nutrient-binding outer membrane lipoprotein [Flavihumibacter sp. UBA7668]